MPTRLVSQTINVSDSISKLSPFDEVVFIHLIVTVDDYGRYYGNVDIVKGALFPTRKEFSVEKIDASLKHLEEAGMVRRYKCEGKEYLELTSWMKYQKPRAKSSKFPGPEDADPEAIQTTIENTCVQIQTETISNKVKPVKVDMEKFDKFWAAYPKHKDRKRAIDVWKKINPDDELFEKIMTGLKEQSKSYDWLKEDGRFVPMPTTWLRNERWNDQIRTQKVTVMAQNEEVRDGQNPFRS